MAKNMTIFAGSAQFRPAVVIPSATTKEEGASITSTQVKTGKTNSIAVVLTSFRGESKIHYWENEPSRVAIFQEQLELLEQQTNGKLLEEIRNSLGAFVVRYNVSAPDGYKFAQVASRDSDDWFGSGEGDKVITKAAKAGELMFSGDGKVLTKQVIETSFIIPDSEVEVKVLNSFGMFDISKGKIIEPAAIARLCEADAIKRFGVEGTRYRLLSDEAIEALSKSSGSSTEVVIPNALQGEKKTGTDN